MKRFTITTLATLAISLFAVTALAQTVAVLTPYLASATTRIMVDEFRAAMQELGYDVNVIDTAGDIAALDSRVHDVITQGVDAIVLSANPELVPAGLEAAEQADIPVFGLDAGSTQGLVLDVTSNNYSMAAQTASYIVDRLGGEGRVVMLVHPPYAPVQKRGVVARAIFDNTPDIEVVEEVFVAVPGPLENARNAVEALLLANPEPGSIAGIWAAWDEPALGALQAIESMGREDEGIVIVGLDAIDPAREAIANGGPFEATVAQDFERIAQTLADRVHAHLTGSEPAQATVYVPARLLTADDLD
ncbi:MAG: substrate-binding domain-containing protein [Trueperaceae bacterium]